MLVKYNYTDISTSFKLWNVLVKFIYITPFQIYLIIYAIYDK